jgi:1-acyl-sn-glycerol-3-phosphate acyltransferase
MEKSDESGQNENEPAPKRPSARRVTTDVESPATESTGKVPKRVHARRPVPTRAPAAGSTEPQSSAPAASSARSQARRTARVSSLPPSHSTAPSADGNAVQSESAACAPQWLAPAPAADTEQGASQAPAADVPGTPEQETGAAQIEVAPLVAARSAECEPIAGADRDVLQAEVVQHEMTATQWPDRVVEGRPESVALAHLKQHGLVSEARAQTALVRDELASAELADDFGLDADYESKVLPWLEKLCKHYVRVELRGANNLPSHGRALLVANHSRAPLWDGIILRTALRLQRETARQPRWLVDDHQYHAPFLGTFVNRLGAVRACQENAERLLSREELVAVFPEGAKAAERRYEDRHRLLRFGRGGYVKLALRTGTPIFPVAIVARDHEHATWRNRLGSASRLLGAPLVALGPRWPHFGFLGAPPWASQIRITIGEPVREITRQDAFATRDDGLVHELNECVRGAVQQLVNTSLLQA